MLEPVGFALALSLPVSIVYALAIVCKPRATLDTRATAAPPPGPFDDAYVGARHLDKSEQAVVHRALRRSARKRERKIS